MSCRLIKRKRKGTYIINRIINPYTLIGVCHFIVDGCVVTSTRQNTSNDTIVENDISRDEMDRLARYTSATFSLLSEEDTERVGRKS